MAHDVLIDPQVLHSGKAFGAGDPGLGFGLDRGPGDAEMTASAETVVSSWLSASVAYLTASTVSTARRGAIGCCSVNVVVAQSGSRQRQSMVSHRRTVTPPRLGRVVYGTAAAAVPDREHPAPMAAVLNLMDSTVSTSRC
jgi:hypothetical protein